MAGWTKLQSSIIHSTIWREPNHIRIVWITMLAMCDSKGEVQGSVPGLSDAARVSLDECIDALGVLSSPDKWSRDQSNDGCRIDDIQGGWTILNYGKYRDPVSTQRVKEHREKQKQKKLDETVSSVSKQAKRDETKVTVETPPDPDPDPESESEAEADPDPEERQIRIFSAAKKPRRKVTEKTDGSKVWDAYSDAYLRRYGVEPARSARTGSLCKQFCKLIPASEAPEVAKYYLTTSSNPYAQSGHTLSLLVRDAEKMRTEYLTGQRITQAQSRENDRVQGMGDGWQRQVDRLKKEGRLEE